MTIRITCQNGWQATLSWGKWTRMWRGFGKAPAPYVPGQKDAYYLRRFGSRRFFAIWGKPKPWRETT